MSPRSPWPAVLLGALAPLMSAGVWVVYAQGAAKPSQAVPSKTLAQVRAERDDLRNKYEAVAYDRDKLEAWIQLGEASWRDLLEGRRVAVVGENRTVFMERAAFNQSLLRHVTQSIIGEAARTGDYNALSLAADGDLLKTMVAALEEDALQKSDVYRQKLAAELAGLRAREGRLFDRQVYLWQQLQQLEEREAELILFESSRGAVTPDSRGKWPLTDPDGVRLSERKRMLGFELEQTRKAGHWSADQHFQVGTLIGQARTFTELSAVATMMHSYAACYDSKNLRRAAVLANARTGMYATPGDRIRDLDTVTAEFNTCIAKAESGFLQARGR